MAADLEIQVDLAFSIMSLQDVSEIMKLEQQIYKHPWTEGIFRDCIRVGYYGWVYKINDAIRAYGLISIAANEAHILNLGVDPAYQGKGLGKKMLIRLIETAELCHVKSLFLEVRASNDVAIHLYESSGFNQLGVRKEYYPGDRTKEDALVFGIELSAAFDDASS